MKLRHFDIDIDSCCIFESQQLTDPAFYFYVGVVFKFLIKIVNPCKMSEKRELDPSEKEVFNTIEMNDIALLRTLLTHRKDVNIFDENLMTPLQHACYKGNLEMVQLLLDQVKL